MKATVVCFGELLLRLSAPAGELLLQSPHLQARFGGAEANVAVSLARWGHDARLVGRLPADALGDAARAEVRRHGVDVSAVTPGEGRMGLYYLTPGAVLRPSEVLYDRAGSAFALTPPSAYDWNALLAGAQWLHLSGVTPAVGPLAAEAALEAAAAARRLGVKVAFDGNYRSKLWAAWGGDAAGILGRLLAQADLAFVDERDLALVFGRGFEAASVHERRREAAVAAFEAFPHLQHLAATVRVQHAVDDQELSGLMFERGGGETAAGPYRLTGVVDRIGAGDAFAAGVLHGLLAGEPPLAFGLAAAAQKHSVAGDFNLVSVDEVRALVRGGGLDVKR